MAWWAPLAISAGSGIINHFAGAKGRRKDKRAVRSRERQQDQSMQQLQEMITGLSDRSDSIRTDYTPTELYGGIMQNITDRVGSDQDTMSSNIFRALMGGGGDISGSGQTALQGLQQTGQRSIADAITRFTELTDARNIGNEQRKDRLETTAMSAQGNLSQMFAGLFGQEQGRSDRKRTAGRQFFLDLLGMGAQASGQLYAMEKDD